MRFSAIAPLLGIVVAPGLLRAQPADRFAGVAPRMQEFVDKGEVAGVVTLVATKDRILHLDAVGRTIWPDRDADDDISDRLGDETDAAVCIAIPGG
jgi:hypothetical protein